MKLLLISGSLRAGSDNARLLRAAAELAPAELEPVEFGWLKLVEPFDEDDEPEPPLGAHRLCEAIRAADAVLFSTPEYNSSIPGQLKNALDWASRPRARSPLAGKPVAVIGASRGIFGAVWAQAELRKVLAASGARVLESEFALGQAHQAFTPAGELADPEQRERLGLLLEGLVALARKQQAVTAAA